MPLPKNQSVSENRPFAACHSRSTKSPCRDAKVALGQDQQKAYIILNGNFLCLSCPSATFASRHGGFVPREWQAAKDLLVGEMWVPLCSDDSIQSHFKIGLGRNFTI